MWNPHSESSSSENASSMSIEDDRDRTAGEAHVFLTQTTLKYLPPRPSQQHRVFEWYAREASADTIRITTSEDVVKEEKTEEKGLKCAMTLEEARFGRSIPSTREEKTFKTTLRRCSVCCAVSVSRVCVDDGIEFLCGRTDEEKFVDKDGNSVSESLLSPFVHAYGCKQQSGRPDECVPCSLTFLEVEKLRRTWCSSAKRENISSPSITHSYHLHNS